MIFDIDSFSDKGPRSENQDALGFDNFLKGSVFKACIADGVGGGRCGAMASSYAVERFITLSSSQVENKRQVLLEINDFLSNQSISNPDCKGIATTLTGFLVDSNYILRGIHVGDSRLCILRGNGLKQLSEDHTEVKRLLRKGLISKEGAEKYPRKNILESALGMPTSRVTIQEFEFQVNPRDRIILTTDGLHNKISTIEMRDLSITSITSKEFCSKVQLLMKTKAIDDNFSLVAVTIP